MTATAAAGCGPSSRDARDEADDLRDLVVAEPVDTSAPELADALDALASLLVDSRAAKTSQGALLTPTRREVAPDGGQPGGTALPPAGAAA